MGRITYRMNNLGLNNLRFLKISNRRILIRSCRINVLTKLRATRILLITYHVNATRDMITRNYYHISALTQRPTPLKPITTKILTHSNHMRRIRTNGDYCKTVNTGNLTGTTLLVNYRQPRSTTTLRTRVTLKSTQVRHSITKLTQDSRVRLARTISVLKRRILRVLRHIVAILKRTMRINHFLRSVRHNVSNTITSGISTRNITTLNYHRGRLTRTLSKGHRATLITQRTQINVKVDRVYNVLTQRTIRRLLGTQHQRRHIIHMTNL